jgi:formylglycine-generating enzyme required for sulfatase activity
MTMVRSAARFRYDQDVRYYANGFRVARDLK